MPNHGTWLYNTWNTGTSTQQLNSLRVQYTGDTGVWTQWVGRDPIDLETKEQRIKRRWRENL